MFFIRFRPIISLLSVILSIRESSSIYSLVTACPEDCSRARARALRYIPRRLWRRRCRSSGDWTRPDRRRTTCIQHGAIALNRGRAISHPRSVVVKGKRTRQRIILYDEHQDNHDDDDATMMVKKKTHNFQIPRVYVRSAVFVHYILQRIIPTCTLVRSVYIKE